jgi:bacterioferritin (cytochrome b1)
MNIKEKINALLTKHGLNLSVEETAQIELAATSKAADGSEIGTPTEFVAGAEIFVVIEGQPTAAPDGEIAMEDGTTIIVKEGKIEEVKPKAEEMSSDVLQAIEKMSERICALESTNATQATELTAANESIKDLNTKLSAAEKKATDAQAEVVKLSKTAATTSVKDNGAVELKKESAESKSKAQEFLESRKHFRSVVENELNKN